MKRVILIIIILTSIGSIFTVSNAFTDKYILPKWYAFIAGVILLLFSIGAALLQKERKQTKNWINTLFINKCLIVICIVQAIWGIVQYVGFFRTHKDFNVVGTFDNPAGFSNCICATFPLGILFFNRHKLLHWIGFVILVISIIISESRTGLISLCVVGLIMLINNNKIHLKWKVAISVLIMIMFVGLIGFYKTDSASGRLLIWECCWNMIKEKPILGYGIHAFKAYYMDYQAAYFQEYPTSKYTALASNVNHPFNEFIGILIKFGFIGLIGLGIILFLLWKFYRHNPTNQSKFAWLSLLAIGVCGMFSYPLSYPFVWLIILFNCFVILSNYHLNCKISQYFHNIIGCILMFVSIVFAYKLAINIQAEYQWKKNLTVRFSKEQRINEYKALMAELGNNPYFLYNYAVVLYYEDLYNESLEIAHKCRTYWADYDLELLQGELLVELERYKEAEHHFLHASRMCPVRFVPLHQLYQLYKKTRCEQKARQMGETILNKPVKVESVVIRSIRNNVRKDFDL